MAQATKAALAKSSPLDALLSAPPDSNPLTEPMIADLKRIMEANAAQPNHKKRFSRARVCRYLRDNYGYCYTVQSFDRHFRAIFGRGWGDK